MENQSSERQAKGKGDSNKFPDKDIEHDLSFFEDIDDIMVTEPNVDLLAIWGDKQDDAVGSVHWQGKPLTDGGQESRMPLHESKGGVLSKREWKGMSSDFLLDSENSIALDELLQELNAEPSGQQAHQSVASDEGMSSVKRQLREKIRSGLEEQGRTIPVQLADTDGQLHWSQAPTEEESKKQADRKERNRQSALKSRLNKKAKEEQLNKSIQDNSEEVKRLKEENLNLQKKFRMLEQHILTQLIHVPTCSLQESIAQPLDFECGLNLVNFSSAQPDDATKGTEDAGLSKSLLVSQDLSNFKTLPDLSRNYGRGYFDDGAPLSCACSSRKLPYYLPITCISGSTDVPVMVNAQSRPVFDGISPFVNGGPPVNDISQMAQRATVSSNESHSPLTVRSHASVNTASPEWIYTDSGVKFKTVIPQVKVNDTGLLSAYSAQNTCNKLASQPLLPSSKGAGASCTFYGPPQLATCTAGNEVKTAELSGAPVGQRATATASQRTTASARRTGVPGTLAIRPGTRSSASGPDTANPWSVAGTSSLKEENDVLDKLISDIRLSEPPNKKPRFQ